MELATVDRRRPGRPRSADLDARIMEAAFAVLEQEGYPGLSIDAVARVAGTTRPSVYRRFASRAVLLMAVLGSRYGVDPAPDTGTIEGDLIVVQHKQIEFFADPAVRAAMPYVLAELHSTPGALELLRAGYVGPRRSSTARALARAAARGEIGPGFDADWICDLITGPLFFRALLPGIGPLDDELVQRTVAAALAALPTAAS
jgi:AcrR family transcriptional regulator